MSAAGKPKARRARRRAILSRPTVGDTFLKMVGEAGG